jgi:DNA-binding NtrC family response regulator
MQSATIGNSAENDIVLPFRGISGRHALLTRTGSGLLLSDAGSKNGIVANGAVVQSLVLSTGTIVQMGAALITVEEADTAELKIAFATGGDGAPARRTPHTDTLLGRGTESDALALIARIERSGAARDEAQAIVAEARRILRASSVALRDVRHGEGAVAALAGPALPGDVVEASTRFLAASPRPDDDVRRVADGTALMSGKARGDRASVLIAYFAGAPRAIEPWERSLFAYLAAKLLSLRSAEAKAGAAPQPARRDEIVAESPQLRALLDAVASVARSERPILIQGETGTGKELIARLLHETGPYANGKLLAVSCAEIPKDLLESELFGVERGVATGVEARAGLFAAADGGSLFLDEIGELPQSMQASLLRILERREVRAVGARAARPVRLRVILATRRGVTGGDPASSAAVRDDLFYRCLPLFIPPLRERPDDIVPLALHFISRVCAEAGLRRVAISEKAIDLLLRHDWPGNVRELEHAVEEAVLRFGRGGILQSNHFAAILRTPAQQPSAPIPTPPPPLHEERARIDRDRIQRALRDTRGNKAAAARLLGLSRNGLLKMIERLGIEER